MPPATSWDGALSSVSILALFFTGLKAGLLTFGGAYTAIPVMRADAARGGWISDGQFLDGVALAQVIPAPSSFLEPSSVMLAAALRAPWR